MGHLSQKDAFASITTGLARTVERVHMCANTTAHIQVAPSAMQRHSLEHWDPETWANTFEHHRAQRDSMSGELSLEAVQLPGQLIDVYIGGFDDLPIGRAATFVVAQSPSSFDRCSFVKQPRNSDSVREGDEAD